MLLACACGSGLCAGLAASLLGLLLIELLGKLVRSFGEVIGGSLDGCGVFAFHKLAQGGDFTVDVALEGGIGLVAQIAE